jgi:hypothetical protein
MTDAPFVVAAYVVVICGLAAYAFALARRTASARRLAALVRREREGDGTPREIGGPLVGRESSEARR